MHVEAICGEAGGQTEHTAQAVVTAVQLVVPVDHSEESGSVILGVEFITQLLQMLLPDIV